MSADDLKKQDLPTRMIGGHKYELVMFSFTAGIKVFNEIVRIIGPVFGGLMAGSKAWDEINIQEGITYLIQNLEDQKIITLLEKFFDQMTRDDLPLGEIYDEVFAGDYDEVLEVLLFSINQNFFRKIDLMSKYDLIKELVSEAMAETLSKTEKKGKKVQQIA